MRLLLDGICLLMSNKVASLDIERSLSSRIKYMNLTNLLNHDSSQENDFFNFVESTPVRKMI